MRIMLATQGDAVKAKLFTQKSLMHGILHILISFNPTWIYFDTI